MIKGLFKLSQRGKPLVSIDQYSPLLCAALKVMDEGVPKFPDDPDTEDMVAYVEEIAITWEEVNSCRIKLEAVQPDPRLSNIHIQTIKVLRCLLPLLNHHAVITRAILKGDFREAGRQRSKIGKYTDTMNKATRDFLMAKVGFVAFQSYLQSVSPDDFLQLPPEVYARLGLNPDWGV